MSLRSLGGALKEKLFLPYPVRAEFRRVFRRLDELEHRIRLLQEGIGRIEARQLRGDGGHDLRDHEFRVFSQWGEDGIVQHLIREVAVPRRVFVEFGVERYEEANTRFLLVNDGWSGLILEANAYDVGRIRQSSAHWRHELKVEQAFVTRDNIDALLERNGVTGEIGLLSIDIDGMDYWVWDAVSVVRPAIVVIEYNHRFGPEAAVTVPYDPSFDRRSAHYSLLYYGASLEALRRLGVRKGYALVGCGSAGLNAFFVREDLRPPALPERTTAEAFVRGRFREAHDEAGNRIVLSPAEETALVMGLPVVEVPP